MHEKILMKMTRYSEPQILVILRQAEGGCLSQSCATNTGWAMRRSANGERNTSGWTRRWSVRWRPCKTKTGVSRRCRPRWACKPSCWRKTLGKVLRPAPRRCLAVNAVARHRVSALRLPAAPLACVRPAIVTAHYWATRPKRSHLLVTLRIYGIKACDAAACVLAPTSIR